MASQLSFSLLPGTGLQLSCFFGLCSGIGFALSFRLGLCKLICIDLRLFFSYAHRLFIEFNLLGSLGFDSLLSFQSRRWFGFCLGLGAESACRLYFKLFFQLDSRGGFILRFRLGLRPLVCIALRLFFGYAYRLFIKFNLLGNLSLYPFLSFQFRRRFRFGLGLGLGTEPGCRLCLKLFFQLDSRGGFILRYSLRPGPLLRFETHLLLSYADRLFK